MRKKMNYLLSTSYINTIRMFMLKKIGNKPCVKKGIDNEKSTV